MGTDHWQPVRVRRLRREPAFKYERRRDEIVEIIDGFRSGRFRGWVADRVDERLQGLLAGTIDVNDPSPFSSSATAPESG
jgi:hypothetical protein